MTIGYVYILTNKPKGTLYIGVTSDIHKRVWEHKQAQGSKFTSGYHLHRLVWVEQHDSIQQAIFREKRLKTWNRQWKIELIEAKNPTWAEVEI
jgi:putative endonuclease